MNIEYLKEKLWSEVNHVLLDMDGTLLDKYFDDYFWGHLVPQKYAEKHNITFGKAKEELNIKYKSQEGTLNWTDIDYWSNELNIDIAALKEQIHHLIEVHPHVEEFLKIVKSKGKKVFLITNAHYKTLEIKMKKTKLGKYFDKVVTSFDIGIPKEEILFWNKCHKKLGFNKDTTLFIDDLVNILETAKEFGIKYLILKKKSNSRRKDNIQNTKFLAINDFRELLPKIKSC